MSNLKKLLIRAKRQVFSEMVGNNPSIFHGEGYDFSELREYQVGDDIKYIDWNITAKMQRPFVKVFKEERELQVSVVSMMGGSLFFGSTRLKQELLSEVVAILSFSAVKNGDLLSSYVISDEIETIVRASKKDFAVRKTVQTVNEYPVLNTTANYENMTKMLMNTVTKKSLMVIVGDFFQIPDLKILSKKHEVIAIIVRDKMEENPPSFGFSSLLDPQSAANLEGHFGTSSVKAYAKRVHDHDHNLYESLKKARVRFTKIYTDENPYVAIRRMFGAI